MTDHEPKPWKRIETKEGPDLKLFKARFDWLENPRNGEQLKRLVLDSRDWVNVVAVTPDEDVVLVRQFRHGTREITLEIPGGMVDAGVDLNNKNVLMLGSGGAARAIAFTLAWDNRMALLKILDIDQAMLTALADDLKSSRNEKLLVKLANDLADLDLYDAQERYVYLFDRTRTLSLHLFEHVHGEEPG